MDEWKIAALITLAPFLLLAVYAIRDGVRLKRFGHERNQSHPRRDAIHERNAHRPDDKDVRGLHSDAGTRD